MAHKENGEVRVNGGRWLVQDLDLLPLPARDMLPLEKYFKINTPMQSITRRRRCVPIITSRGCPYRCTFCSSCIHWGGRYRRRSPENILEEMQVLKDEYNVRELKFEDDNLTFDKERTKALFRGMIERGFDFLWNTPNGIAVRHLDDEMLCLMKESGCYDLTLAIESGDPEVLKNIINKPMDLAEAKRAAQRIKRHGIWTSGFFIIGLPGETKQQVMNTIKFIEELALDRIYLFMYTPLPGTPLAERAISQGLVREDFDFEKAVHYFNPNIKLSDMTSQELLRVQRRALFRNNIKPLFRRPDKFFRQWGPQAMAHPEMIVKLVKSVL